VLIAAPAVGAAVAVALRDEKCEQTRGDDYVNPPTCEKVFTPSGIALGTAVAAGVAFGGILLVKTKDKTEVRLGVAPVTAPRTRSMSSSALGGLSSALTGRF